MSGPKKHKPVSDYSSGLTRRLVEQADSLLGEENLRPEEIEEQFANIDEGILSAMQQAQQQQESLSRLMGLVGNKGQEPSGLSGSLRLTISEDEMFISATITPPTGDAEAVSVEQVIGHLRDMGVRQGVLLDAIKGAVEEASQGTTAHDRVIARGWPPEAETEPQPAYYARVRGDSIEEVAEEQLMAGVEFPVFCQQGDTVCIIQPGRKGRDGYTATGRVLKPPPVKPIDLKEGDNVRFQSGRYTATASGVVVIRDGRIGVEKALIIDTDVDRSHSPLTYDGSIFIRGGVHSGVTIEATGDIVIDRVVESASVTSTRGEVVLRAGIAGRGKGHVQAAQNFKSGFVENSSIVAGGCIILGTGSLNSHLTATNDILAEVGKGSIAGGVVIAGNSVRAKRIGSTGTSTILIIGVGPRDIPELNRLSQEMAGHQRILARANELIAQFERAVKDPTRLTEQERAAYANVYKLRVVTEHNLRELEASRQKALQASVAHTDGNVKVYQQLGPQVVFHFGAMKYTHPEAKGPITIGFEPEYGRIAYRNK